MKMITTEERQRLGRRNKSCAFTYEMKCIQELKKEGYSWAHRSYASKGSHGFDVIAANRENVLFIQVKSTKRNIVHIQSIENQFKKDIDVLRDIPINPTVQCLLWVWTAKQGKAGEQGYRKAGWRKFRVTETGLIEYE